MDKKAFGDAVSHIDSGGFAPFGHDDAVANDDARSARRVVERGRGLAISFARKRQVMGTAADREEPSIHAPGDTLSLR